MQAMQNLFAFSCLDSVHHSSWWRRQLLLVGWLSLPPFPLPLARCHASMLPCGWCLLVRRLFCRALTVSRECGKRLPFPRSSSRSSSRAVALDCARAGESTSGDRPPSTGTGRRPDATHLCATDRRERGARTSRENETATRHNHEREDGYTHTLASVRDSHD